MMRQPGFSRTVAEHGRTVYTYRFDFEGKLNYLKKSLQPRLKGCSRPVQGESRPH